MDIEKKDFKKIIIDSGLKVFLKYGYTKTTMDDIAEQCKKSKASLYNYIKNKEELFREVVEMRLQTLHKDIYESTNQSSNLTDALCRFIEVWYNFYFDGKDDFNKIISDRCEHFHIIKDILSDNFKFLTVSLKKLLLNYKNEREFTEPEAEKTAKMIIRLFYSMINPVCIDIFSVNEDLNIKEYVNLIIKGIKSTDIGD